MLFSSICLIFENFGKKCNGNTPLFSKIIQFKQNKKGTAIKLQSLLVLALNFKKFSGVISQILATVLGHYHHILHTETDFLAGVFYPDTEFFQLGRTVEYDMVRIEKKLLKVFFPVSGAKYVAFLTRHFLCTESGFVKAAGLGSCKVWCQYRI